MVDRSPMHHEILSVPELLRAITPTFDSLTRAAFDFEFCTSVKRVAIVGCGDSHHAGVGAELAFKQLAGIPARGYSALSYSRYEAGYLNPTSPKTEAVIAISSSGSAARTVEALRLGQLAGAEGFAFTGNAASQLGQTAQTIFQLTLPPPPDVLAGAHTPGVRSYAASQLALYLTALRIGEVRGHLTTAEADSLRRELAALAEVAEATIAACEPLSHEIVAGWKDAGEVVYVGAGPLYATALYSAAKLVEASGKPGLPQETEEWGHIQFFAEPAATPTVLFDAGGFSTGRAEEIAQSARTIGRALVAVTGPDSAGVAQHAQAVLPVAATVRECFAPLVYFLPGALLAASMAQALGAVYYRDFSGGRSQTDYDIRSSRQITQLIR